MIIGYLFIGWYYENYAPQEQPRINYNSCIKKYNSCKNMVGNMEIWEAWLIFP